MDDSAKAIFNKLSDNLTDCFYRLKVYKEVYMGDEEQLDLLNSSGCNFFHYTQQLMIDDLILRVSRMTDNSQMGRGWSANENLCLQRLILIAVDMSNDFLTVELTRKLKEIERATDSFRSIRHKRLAHTDLQHAMGKLDSVPAGVSILDINIVFILMADFLDIFELKTMNSQTGYEQVKGPYGAGGDGLIKALSGNRGR